MRPKTLSTIVLVPAAAAALVLLAVDVTAQTAPSSQSVKVLPSGRLYPVHNQKGDRVPDFSNVGYKGGLAAIPVAPVKVTVNPASGDDGTLIQNAINQVSAMAPDANGIRGAVLLNAGEYQIAGSINITASGVVLRGVGDSATSGTRLFATGTTQRTLVNVTGSSTQTAVPGTTHNLVAPYTPVGARSFLVDSTDGLAVGDKVIVERPSTAEWIHDINADLLDNPWTPGSKNLQFDRIITRIEGNAITIDAPLVNSFEARYGGGTIYKYTSARIENVGIEDIYTKSAYVNSTDEAHGWTFIHMSGVENAWVKNITAQYYGYSAVTVAGNSKWVTVDDGQMLDPISQVTGGRRYSFLIDGATQVLFKNCFARSGRHDYVLGSSVPGPNVFVDSRGDSALDDTGPHHRWSAGALFDNIVTNKINVRNRGNSGTGHGWPGANMVIWNATATTSFRVENAPTAQNWLIGSIGTLDPNPFSAAVGPTPPGIFDTHGTKVNPRSLYYGQFAARTAVPTGLIYREYTIGDSDAFTGSGPTGDAVYVDPQWQTDVALATAVPQVGFDQVAANQVVPFTFAFTLDPGEWVSSATLTLMPKAGAGGNVNNDLLYLDTMASGSTFSSLGWLPLSATKAVGLEVDPALLADGKLNVATSNDVGIDWAVLEIRVAPAGTPTTPTGVGATASAGKITVSWTAAVAAATYNIKRATSAAGPFAAYQSGITGTSYNDTAVTAGTTYYYVVSGVSGSGVEGATSAAASATAPSPPAAPSGVTATVGDKQTMLAWTASPGATSYNVKRSTTNGGPYTTVGSPVTNSFINTGLTNGTTNYYRVSSITALGESANSAQVSAAPSTAACKTATGGASAPGSWINTSFTAQSGTFVAEYDATVSVSAIDGTVGLSNGAQTAYTGLATATRFFTTNLIDARNGANFAAATNVPYTPNSTYHFRLVVNVQSRTHTIYVTPPGGSEIALGTNYAFRTEQAGVTSLNNWNIRVNQSGTSRTNKVCNFWIHP
jgi:fibronectin type 3 domain-containing protein